MSEGVLVFIIALLCAGNLGAAAKIYQHPIIGLVLIVVVAIAYGRYAYKRIPLQKE